MQMTVVGSTRVERMEGTCAGGKSVLTCLRATFVKESRSYDGERERERERDFKSFRIGEGCKKDKV